MRRGLAIGISYGMTVGFGIIFVIMTVGIFLTHDIIIDKRYFLYLGLVLISLLQWVLIVKGTQVKKGIK